MAKHYPNVETNFYVQEEMLGQTHAIAMAREQMYGPTLVMFSDTLVEDDLSFLSEPNANYDGVVWVKPVEDPRRFGVVVVGEDGFISDFIEKPDSVEHKLAIVGYYYFARGEDLMAAIDTQLNNNMITKGEYYLVDAMKIMMENGQKLFPKPVDVWLDAGVPDTVLETNRYLLEHGRDNTADISSSDGIVIHPPVNIHPTAVLRSSTIGPDVTIGAGCKVENSEISYSVIEDEAKISDSKLKESLVGERAVVSGLRGQFVIGDDSLVKGE
jgi:glucose-1-phosphate thymidylyltransferase